MRENEPSGAKQIALWGAWYGSRNVGDQTLLLTITDILTRMLGNVRFTVFTDDPEHVATYTRCESNSRVDALHNRRQFPRLVATLAKCDLLIIGGGVPFYEERLHLIAMGVIVGLARLFRTPYMTWTVSSQESQNRSAKRLFKWVIDGAQAVTYRDDHTYKLFKSCGVQREMYFAADSGYWLEPEGDEIAREIIIRSSHQDFERPLAALTPRTLLSQRQDAEKHYRVKTPQLFEREIDCFAAVLDWLWNQGYQPILVPMNTVAPDDDRIAARRVLDAARYGDKALLIDEEIRPRVAPAIFRQCACSFVARVHGSVTSFIGRCPVMMYAFAPKHAGIMEAMGLSSYTLLESSAEPDKAVEILSDLLKNRDHLRYAMVKKLADLRQNALIPAHLAIQILNSTSK